MFLRAFPRLGGHGAASYTAAALIVAARCMVLTADDFRYPPFPAERFKEKIFIHGKSTIGDGTQELRTDARTQIIVVLKWFKDFEEYYAFHEARILKTIKDLGDCVTQLVDNGIYQSKKEDGTSIFVIVTEYTYGDSLHSLIVGNGTMNEQLVCAAIKDLLTIVDQLASHKIIHGNITLSNLIQRPNGKITLVDFSMANYMDENGNTNIFGGTPTFIAPEVHRRKFNGVISASFSIGTVLVALLAGYPEGPFYDATDVHHERTLTQMEDWCKHMTMSPLVLPQTLAKSLLQCDPSKRSTLRTALEHSWITQCPYIEPQHHLGSPVRSTPSPAYVAPQPVGLINVGGVAGHSGVHRSGHGHRSVGGGGRGY